MFSGDVHCCSWPCTLLLATSDLFDSAVRDCGLDQQNKKTDIKQMHFFKQDKHKFVSSTWRFQTQVFTPPSVVS